jgi:zinc/manganese transport system substrate-binding protein
MAAALNAGLLRRRGDGTVIGRNAARSLVGVVLAMAAAALAPACGGAGVPASPTVQAAGGVVKVVAAENFWGSIAAQVGGSHAKVASIIADPNADPHDYEPTAQDARAVADSQYVVYNGAGYDPWMDKLLAANPAPNRKALNIGEFLGKREGDNPHFWYGPDYVAAVAARIRDDLKALDPADAGAFDALEQQFQSTALERYHSLINDLKARYSGTPIGATESIFAYMAKALGLQVLTPPSYMNAVSEGQDVSAADQITVENQISQKLIKILVYNSQNTPPNVQALLAKAKVSGIPVATVTETLDPATALFQDWQSVQLQGVEDALKQALGR